MQQRGIGFSLVPNELRSMRLHGGRRIDRALKFSASWTGLTHEVLADSINRAITSDGQLNRICT
jgi:hypothetical protein